MEIYECKLSFRQCREELKEAIKRSGVTVFYEIDHRENAKSAGLDMEEATVIFFGNPRVGTLLMQRDTKCAYELPLRMLVCTEGGKAMIGFNYPSSLLKEYKLEEVKGVLEKMDGLMRAIVKDLEERNVIV